MPQTHLQLLQTLPVTEWQRSSQCYQTFHSVEPSRVSLLTTCNLRSKTCFCIVTQSPHSSNHRRNRAVLTGHATPQAPSRAPFTNQSQSECPTCSSQAPGKAPSINISEINTHGPREQTWEIGVLTASFVLSHILTKNTCITEQKEPHSRFSLTGLPQQATLNLIF